MANIQIFCDFDGTITKTDTLNKFLKIYADKKWLDFELEWEQGKIGSRECIREQMQLFSNMTEEKMNDYLAGIQIDEYFLDFFRLIKDNGIEFYIVSDGFDLFINKILKNFSITGVKIFANKLTFDNGTFITEFPFTDEDCAIAAGVCKCNILKKYRNVTKSLIYIGDGLSDFCAAEKADFLFAKERLLEYCKKNKSTNKIITINIMNGV